MYPSDESNVNTAINEANKQEGAVTRLIRLAQELQEDARKAQEKWMERYT